MKYIGIDLGGTNIAGGIVDENGIILWRDSVPTGQGDAVIIRQIASLIHDLLEHEQMKIEEISGIGVGVPGTANQKTGMLEFANNLGIDEEPFLAQLASYFPDSRLYFENDANAAAYAEYRFGAGKGTSSMIMVTLGTGIGGGIILNGKIFEGINYAAGEFGHFVIDRNGLPCNCGRRGCFERYASTSALVEQAQDMMRLESATILWDLCDHDIEKVNGKQIVEAVQKGDLYAKQVFDTYLEYLGIGIVDIINIFQPEMICIGGGISKAGALLTGPVHIKVRKESYTRMSDKQPRIVAAELGNDAGIIGAALLGEQTDFIL